MTGSSSSRYPIAAVRERMRQHTEKIAADTVTRLGPEIWHFSAVGLPLDGLDKRETQCAGQSSSPRYITTQCAERTPG